MSIDKDKKPTHQSVCVGTTEPEYCDMATNMSILLTQDTEMVTDVSNYHYYNLHTCVIIQLTLLIQFVFITFL